MSNRMSKNPATGKVLMLAVLGLLASASTVGNRSRQSPISASSAAARTLPERGRLVKIWPSGWRANCSPIRPASRSAWRRVSPVARSSAHIFLPLW